MDGSGESALRSLRAEARPPTIIVFSAYTYDADAIRHLGADEVVSKPDLDVLGEVLAKVSTTLEEAASQAANERRQATTQTSPPPDLWRSPGGIARFDDLLTTAEHTQLGDTVLVVSLVTDLGRPTPLGTAAAAGVGELLCSVVRVQDVVHELPDIDGYVAVLRGGNDIAANGVWGRLAKAEATTSLPGQITGGWTLVAPLGTMAAVARAQSAPLSADGGPDLRAV